MPIFQSQSHNKRRKVQPDRRGDGIAKGLSQGAAYKTDTHQNYTQNFGYSLTEDTAVLNYKHQSVNAV